MGKTSTDARHIALGLVGVWDSMRKLEWEVDCFHAEAARRMVLPSPSEERLLLRRHWYAAINAASTGWSMIEWLWADIENDATRRQRLIDRVSAPRKEQSKPQLDALKSGLRARVPVIDVSYGIAHAAKHVKLGQMPIHLIETRLNISVWASPAGDLALSYSSDLDYGPSHPLQKVDDFLDELVVWWRDLLLDLEVPDKQRM